MAETTVSIEFDLSLTTDPLGAELDIAVPDAPGEESRQALLDNAERTMVGAQDNLVFQSIQRAHRQLSRYGTRNDYDTDPIEESFAGVDYSRDRTSIHAEWSWSHEAAGYFEFGTSDHTIQGQPLLVFEFDGSEYPGLAEMFPDETAFLREVEVSGLPESRWVRESLNTLRREVGQA
jgi:hypothetical protein